MKFILVSDQIVNLDNIVTFDIDNGLIVRIWYIGSTVPVTLERPIRADMVFNEMRQKGLI